MATFEPGDCVVYNPTINPLRPISQRPWDVGTVVTCDNTYVYVNLDYYNQHIIDPHAFLKYAIIHHPLSEKGVRQRMRAVLPDIVSVVEGRVAALVLSELTGITACRGFGPADVLRHYLDPRPPARFSPRSKA
jgi:hypothetical protein